jgi:hypothetical protein
VCVASEGWGLAIFDCDSNNSRHEGDVSTSDTVRSGFCVRLPVDTEFVLGTVRRRRCDRTKMHTATRVTQWSAVLDD